MFDRLKKSLGWRSFLPALGISLCMACTSAQAGWLDAVTDGIGSVKDKISSSTSGDSKPADPCQAEIKTVCDALANSIKNGNEKARDCEYQGFAGTAATKDLDMISVIKATAQLAVKDMAVEAKQDFPSYSADKKAWQRAKYAYYVCAAKAYDAEIEALKGPDPATFKPVIPTVKAENLEALPKTKKVILSNFVVEFQQQYEKRKSGFSIMGLGNAGSSTAILDATLPSQSTLQAITNFAYLDTVKKLRAKGYEVIEVSQISEQSKSSYDKLTQAGPIKSGEVFDNIDGQSVLVSPTGMISTLPNSGCTHFGSRKAGTNLSNNMRHISTNGQTAYESELSNAEGKIPLLKVWIAVEFGEVDAKGGNAFISARQRDFLGNVQTTVSNSANASATQGMFLEPGVTHFSFELPADGQKYNHSCGITFSNSTVTPPTDGDVFIRLAEKYRDDGDSAPLKMSGEAGTVGVTDTYLGGGIGIRRVKDNDSGTQAQAFDNGKGATVTQHADRTSGTVDVDGMGTALHTTRAWTADIRSDVYAASAATMIYKVTDAFVGKLP